MLTGYAAWRPQQLEYAVEKGINVFMEKSFATDPPAVRRVIKAGEAAEKKNLKIAAGLMCRHSKNRQELIKRIRDGELGRDPTDPRLPHGARRTARAAAAERKGPLLADPQLHPLPLGLRRPVGRDGHPPDRRDLLDQGRLSGLGARHRRPGGQQHRLQPEPRLLLRRVDLCRRHQGLRRGALPARTATTNSPPSSTARSARRSSPATSTPAPCRSTRTSESPPTTSPGRRRRKEIAPWQAEWNVLLDAIRNDRPHNEAKRAALSNLADIMGRAAIHSGKIITWDEAMASNFQWCPNIDSLNENSPPPIQADAQGRYPCPCPARGRKCEFGQRFPASPNLGRV